MPAPSFASAQCHIEIAGDVGRDLEPDVARGLRDEVMRELLAVAVGCARDTGAVTRVPVELVEQASRELRSRAPACEQMLPVTTSDPEPVRG